MDISSRSAAMGSRLGWVMDSRSQRESVRPCAMVCFWQFPKLQLISGMDNGLGFEEFPKSNLTPCPAVPRHLVTAKRGFRVFVSAVNVDHARFDPGSDLVCAFIARGLYKGAEPVDGIVGDSNGLIEVLVAAGARDRAN